MKVGLGVLAAVIIALLPSAALADDPHDPAMRTAAARARDHEMIRQLNRDELKAVRERDARYAQGWRQWREAHSGDKTAARSSEYERANAEYAKRRADYEREMAEWRRNVEACRSGDYSACES